jgi:hypothetical protein
MNTKTIGYLVAAAFAIATLWIIKAGYSNWKWPPAILIPTIGLLTFFGVLIVANLFSRSRDLREGEVRTAVAASLLAVYFFLLAVTLFASSSPMFRIQPGTVTPSSQADADPATRTTGPRDNLRARVSETETLSPANQDLIRELLGSYTSLLMVVIGFYFGGRSVEQVAKTLKG